MRAAAPGSQLTVWCATTGGPWNALFTPEQAAASAAAVDHFLVMAYSLGPFMVANAPLPTLAGRFLDIQGRGAHGNTSWGIPAHK
eukprot:SAG22_NODE_21825_length_253_cov_1.675325_1_plen_84_part_11